MKKIIIAMAAIAAAFTMASCNKELVNPNENPTVGKSVVTASIENDLTKAYLDANGNDTDGYKVYWSEGDNLFVDDYWEEDWFAEFTLENSSAGSSRGIFKWNKDENYFYQVKRKDGTKYYEPIFEIGKTYEAIFPFSFFYFNDDGFVEGNTWKTEQTYADMYIPMYGKAECTEEGKADFVFTNLGGLLRLTVKGTATISSITIQATEQMSGEAGLIEDAEGNIVAEIVGGYPLMKNEVTLDCGNNGVALTDAGTDFYISLPCYMNSKKENIGYSNVTITLTDTEGRTCEKKLNNKNLVIERSKITTASFTASEFKANVPEGALPGKFSVSADKQVYFSKGNLWADDSNTLHFEDAQWKSTPASSGSKDASHVSHFTWTIPVEAAVIGSKIGSNLFCDEAHKQSVDGSDNIYYTLSTVEWQYLFNYWDYANEIRKDKCKWAKVNGVGGYVIAPGDFTGTLKEEYTDDAALAAAGNLVFLPAAGYYDDPIFTSVGNCGYYWSSSAFDGSLAYFVLFDSILDPVRFGSRRYGYSVRLVTDCE